MENARHRTTAELEAGLPAIRDSPGDSGVLELIVRRPRVDEREVLPEGGLDLQSGLLGDNWSSRASSRTADGTAHPDMQLTLMNSRVISLLARVRDRWPLAGDQLLVDLDLSTSNMPVGTRLKVGSAIVEITDQPHTGCSKFAARFGHDALRFVNSPVGRELRLRGVYARVVQPGLVRTGDLVSKM